MQPVRREQCHNRDKVGKGREGGRRQYKNRRREGGGVWVGSETKEGERRGRESQLMCKQLNVSQDPVVYEESANTISTEAYFQALPNRDGNLVHKQPSG